MSTKTAKPKAPPKYREITIEQEKIPAGFPRVPYWETIAHAIDRGKPMAVLRSVHYRDAIRDAEIPMLLYPSRPVRVRAGRTGAEDVITLEDLKTIAATLREREEA